MIKAAGGVVVRDGCVLVVHRPRHDDWSLPKGKLDAGETWAHAALRELTEETGLRCTLGNYLGETRYDVEGEPKTVRWWLMTADGEPVPSREVDEVRWVELPDAPALLTYERDRELLQRLP